MAVAEAASSHVKQDVTASLLMLHGRFTCWAVNKVLDLRIRDQLNSMGSCAVSIM